jgi:hydroxylamine reductase
VLCFQCEQTRNGTGCTTVGVCGKDTTSAALQDLLIYTTEGISMYAHRARQLGARDPTVDRFVAEALFSTVTNVNFDPARLQALLQKAAVIRRKAVELCREAAKKAALPFEELKTPSWKRMPSTTAMINIVHP